MEKKRLVGGDVYKSMIAGMDGQAQGVEEVEKDNPDMQLEIGFLENDVIGHTLLEYDEALDLNCEVWPWKKKR